MLSLYRTLSTRYLSKRWFRATLIVACIALGVATLVATRALSETMNTAGLQASNPLAGTADLLVSGGASDKVVDLSLVNELVKVAGVKSVHPRLFSKARLPDLEYRSVLLMGLDVDAEKASGGNQLWSVTIDEEFNPDHITLANLPKLLFDPKLQEVAKAVAASMAETQQLRLPSFAVIGKDLEQDLPQKIRETRVMKIILPGSQKAYPLLQVGTVDAQGSAVALGGNIVVVNLADANELLGWKNKATRIDLLVQPGENPQKIKAAVQKMLNGRAEVHTPDEQNQMVQNVFAGMQTGFSLCGLAALVVGLFLVYNALAVSVAERRHEIGVILSLGATRAQIQFLFAGEAALLGLLGSLLGIPLGIGLAYLGLQPVQQVLRDVFMELQANQVDVSPTVILLALVAGTLTAILAALVPAIAASSENPAAAVRRIPPRPTWTYRAAQIVFASGCLAIGLVLILVRELLPKQIGTFGGMVLVLLGALVATPLLAAVAATLLQPVVRRVMGIEGRLAADNLVRSPARTGLVIAALAAGVSLVMQIAGTIKSNRVALRDWVRDTIGADLFVTSGSAIGAGGQSELMPAELRATLAKIPGVHQALPVRSGKHPYQGDKQILILGISAGEMYEIESGRHSTDPTRNKPNPLFQQLGQQENAMIVSENFRAKHGKSKGDTITLTTDHGPVQFHVIGEMVDYSWNDGTLIVSHKDYLRHWGYPKLDVVGSMPVGILSIPEFGITWGDDKVEVYDIYLTPGTDPEKVRQKILRAGTEYGLVVQTRGELQERIDGMIERLYGIAYGQLVVVMIVAALGVVTALLISVLQRRREMGLLRAIGASQIQVVRSVLAEAALMGVIGTLIGLVVGIPMEWYVLQVVLLEESGYLFAVYIPWTEALVIAGTAIALATLAGLGPALYAVRERIPEAIAYE